LVFGGLYIQESELKQSSLACAMVVMENHKTNFRLKWRCWTPY